MITLWFTFKFVSLNHWKQHPVVLIIHPECCDLLSNLYLWTIGNNSRGMMHNRYKVVIYFQICIFEPLETTRTSKPFFINSCDLLSNLYLWTIGNNPEPRGIRLVFVVIYFQICIFEPLETTTDKTHSRVPLLWFTFKFVSLNHWKQLQR